MTTTSQRNGGNLAYVFLLTFVAALGGLLFGYDTAVIAGAIGHLKTHFALTPLGEGFAAACALAGCAVGAGAAGFLNDRFGRKKVLILAGLAFFVSALGTALPRTLTEFILFRLLGGLGVGAASITSPMYIAEIAPSRIRGRMVSLNQLAIISGMLFVFFVNYVIAGHGQAIDRRTVAAHAAENGGTLNPAFVRTFLQARVPKMIDRQIEQFLIEPRESLDRRAVAAFLTRQGTPTAAATIAGDDKPLSPTFVRDLLRERLQDANRRRIDEFAAASHGAIYSRAVADFLAKSEINIEPVDVDLAAQDTASWNTRLGWRWMFASGVFPAAIFIILLFFVPESPRWLTQRGRRDEAMAILARVDGPEYAQTEIRGIEETIALESGRLADLWRPGMRRVLAIGVALAVLQQVTGVNVFLYFAPKVFASLGAVAATAMLQTVIVGAVNLAFTVLAVGVVDRLGRKPLMLIGSIGMGVGMTALGLAAYWQLFQWWALVFVLGYIACFAISVGPVTWVILSEIFPTQVRGRAMGIATVCLWLANYVVSQTFPMMDENPWLLARFHHGFPFWVYAGFCVVLLIVVWRWVPETKGKTLEEIERGWMEGRVV